MKRGRVRDGFCDVRAAHVQAAKIATREINELLSTIAATGASPRTASTARCCADATCTPVWPSEQTQTFTRVFEPAAAAVLADA